MNPLLLALSFLLGVGLTWLWAIRTVHREVPTRVLMRVWQTDAETGQPSPAAVEKARRAQAAARHETELFDQEDDAD